MFEPLRLGANKLRSNHLVALSWSPIRILIAVRLQDRSLCPQGAIFDLLRSHTALLNCLAVVKLMLVTNQERLIQDYLHFREAEGTVAVVVQRWVEQVRRLKASQVDVDWVRRQLDKHDF